MVCGKPTSKSLKRGFSLLEMLIFVGILGIMANIVILAFGGGQREIILETKNRRNAQEIVSTASAAIVAGANFLVPGNEEATVRNLVAGTTPEKGIFRGRTFRVPSMTTDDIQGALSFVTLTQDGLRYDGAP